MACWLQFNMTMCYLALELHHPGGLYDDVFLHFLLACQNFVDIYILYCPTDSLLHVYSNILVETVTNKQLKHIQYVTDMKTSGVHYD